MIKISRTKGGCSVCTRGRWHAGGVVLIKMTDDRPKLTPAEIKAGWRMPVTWLGLCLVCAAKVAKAVVK